MTPVVDFAEVEKTAAYRRWLEDRPAGIPCRCSAVEGPALPQERVHLPSPRTGRVGSDDAVPSVRKTKGRIVTMMRERGLRSPLTS